jgi:acyl carrier protein
MSRSSFSDRFEQVVRRHVSLATDVALPFEADLNAVGLDSLGAVKLLVDLEDTFGISFPGTLLTPETFRTAATLKRAVISLTGSSR